MYRKMTLVGALLLSAAAPASGQSSGVAFDIQPASSATGETVTVSVTGLGGLELATFSVDDSDGA